MCLAGNGASHGGHGDTEIFSLRSLRLCVRFQALWMEQYHAEAQRARRIYIISLWPLCLCVRFFAVRARELSHRGTEVTEGLSLPRELNIISLRSLRLCVSHQPSGWDNHAEAQSDAEYIILCVLCASV